MAENKKRDFQDLLRDLADMDSSAPLPSPPCPECHSRDNIAFMGKDFDLLGDVVNQYTCLDCGKEFSEPVEKRPEREATAHLDDAENGGQVFREDQACQGFYCGSAPLGCSDSRYCPRKERGV